MCLGNGVGEGWRTRGHQWTSAGVPQCQPSTCYYHFWQTGPGAGSKNLSMTEVKNVDRTYARVVHLNQTCHIFGVFFPLTSTGLLSCLSGLVTRNKTSPPFPCRQYNDKLSIFLIAAFALVLCVCMSPCVRLSLDVLLSFRAFCVCVCCPLQLCGTSCVCTLYLVNLLQESRLPAEAPSFHITSVRFASLPGGLLVWLKNTHRVHSWVICDWSLCVLCVWAAICSISVKLCLTSRVYWLYLPPSPGIPAPGEQAASSTTVALNYLWQTRTALESETKSARKVFLRFCNNSLLLRSKKI